MDITLCPFPTESLSSAWKWMREFPDANLDDASPKTFAEFEAVMRQRMQVEALCGVRFKNKLVGIIGYLPISPRYGMFHGICFSQAVHGTGVAREAVRIFLARLFATGVDKIAAVYWADNIRIRKLLTGLGARDEGYLNRHTVRQGKPIDAYLVAFFKE